MCSEKFGRAAKGNAMAGWQSAAGGCAGCAGLGHVAPRVHWAAAASGPSGIANAGALVPGSLACKVSQPEGGGDQHIVSGRGVAHGGLAAAHRLVAHLHRRGGAAAGAGQSARCTLQGQEALQSHGRRCSAVDACTFFHAAAMLAWDCMSHAPAAHAGPKPASCSSPRTTPGAGRQSLPGLGTEPRAAYLRGRSRRMLSGQRQVTAAVPSLSWSWGARPSTPNPHLEWVPVG